MAEKIIVKHPYYPTQCETCGWFGSSQSCGRGDYFAQDDVICPECHTSMCGNEPSPENMKRFEIQNR